MSAQLEFDFLPLRIKKKVPLQISRGIRPDSENLFVRVRDNGLTGWGECVLGENSDLKSAKQMKISLSDFISKCTSWNTTQELNNICKEEYFPSFLHAGLDVALWDLWAKRSDLPLNQLLGLPIPTKATSFTIGINPLERVKELIPELLNRLKVDCLKVKLGSPNGIEFDQELFSSVVEASKPYSVKLRVDANGGWNVIEAKKMMLWLHKLSVEFVEQPLSPEHDDYLKELYVNRPLPIFLDESVDFASQVPTLASYIDGVNIKLMKCGGITEALNILSVAENYKLKTMIGCMSESSISIAAGASISGAIDFIDLDSCYNLDPDPAYGVDLVNGITTNRQIPGHGANLKKEYLVTT